MSRGCELDGADLPAGLQKLAATLLAPQKSAAGANSQARDLQCFTFHIKDGKENTTVEFDDITLPEKLQPLVKHLMKGSKPIPLT